MDPFSLLVGFAGGAVIAAVIFIWRSPLPSDDGEDAFEFEDIDAAPLYDGGLIIDEERQLH